MTSIRPMFTRPFLRHYPKSPTMPAASRPMAANVGTLMVAEHVAMFPAMLIRPDEYGCAHDHAAGHATALEATA